MSEIVWTMETSYPVKPVLDTDFNAIGVYCDCRDRACGHVLCRVQHWLLKDGQVVVVHDGDGNACDGRVESVRPAKYAPDHLYAEVRLDLTTWRDSPLYKDPGNG